MDLIPGLTQLRLQIAKGNALIAAQGHHAHATTAAFARARELAAQLDDPPERFVGLLRSVGW